jgi:hypothetical protein
MANEPFVTNFEIGVFTCQRTALTRLVLNWYSTGTQLVLNWHSTGTQLELNWGQQVLNKHSFDTQLVLSQLVPAGISTRVALYWLSTGTQLASVLNWFSPSLNWYPTGTRFNHLAVHVRNDMSMPTRTFEWQCQSMPIQLIWVTMAIPTAHSNSITDVNTAHSNDNASTLEWQCQRHTAYSNDTANANTAHSNTMPMVTPHIRMNTALFE